MPWSIKWSPNSIPSANRNSAKQTSDNYSIISPKKATLSPINSKVFALNFLLASKKPKSAPLFSTIK